MTAALAREEKARSFAALGATRSMSFSGQSPCRVFVLSCFRDSSGCVLINDDFDPLSTTRQRGRLVWPDVNSYLIAADGRREADRTAVL